MGSIVKMRSRPGGRRPATHVHSKDLKKLTKGLCHALLGVLCMAALFGINSMIRLDTLLLASHAIYNVLSGVHGLGSGFAQLLLGVGQMIGFAALATAAIMAILALASGITRISLGLMPQLISVWKSVVQMLAFLAQSISIQSSELRVPQVSTSVASDRAIPLRQRSASRKVA